MSRARAAAPARGRRGRRRGPGGRVDGGASRSRSGATASRAAFTAPSASDARSRRPGRLPPRGRPRAVAASSSARWAARLPRRGEAGFRAAVTVSATAVSWSARASPSGQGGAGRGEGGDAAGGSRPGRPPTTGRARRAGPELGLEGVTPHHRVLQRRGAGGQGDLRWRQRLGGRPAPRPRARPAPRGSRPRARRRPRPPRARRAPRPAVLPVRRPVALAWTRAPWSCVSRRGDGLLERLLLERGALVTLGRLLLVVAGDPGRRTWRGRDAPRSRTPGTSSRRPGPWRAPPPSRGCGPRGG